jgi:hypothetical protein
LITKCFLHHKLLFVCGLKRKPNGHLFFPACFICSFLLAQKRTKKGSQSLGLPAADYPVLLKKDGRCETRHFQWLRQSSRYSFFFCAARLREMAFNYI